MLASIVVQMFYNGNLSLIIKVLIPTNAVLIFIVFLPVGFLRKDSRVC